MCVCVCAAFMASSGSCLLLPVVRQPGAQRPVLPLEPRDSTANAASASLLHASGRHRIEFLPAGSSCASMYLDSFFFFPVSRYRHKLMYSPARVLQFYGRGDAANAHGTVDDVSRRMRSLSLSLICIYVIVCLVVSVRVLLSICRLPT
jgi:hypothetical protein